MRESHDETTTTGSSIQNLTRRAIEQEGETTKGLPPHTTALTSGMLPRRRRQAVVDGSTQ